MSHSNGLSLSARGAAAFAAALTLGGAPGTAAAQQAQGAPPPVQGMYTPSQGATRYATPDGSVSFVFDRSGGRAALVRFQGDPEVHVLRPVMAAGGGEIYRTEDGSVMLRVMPHGGITVFTRSIRAGAPVSEVEHVAPLAPEAMAFAEMQQRFDRLQQQARRSVGQTVQIQVQAPAPSRMSPAAVGVIVDAAERAVEGLSAAPMTTVHRVLIVLGPTPAVALRGDLLIIQVAPQLGYAGRPSSNTIRNVVTGAVQGPEQ